MAWIFLIIAAAFEAAWTFALKYMKFKDLKLLRINRLLDFHHGFLLWGPFAGYILFGVGNIYFFSLAIKQLPIATAYAVWTAVTLVLIKCVDMTFFNQRMSLAEALFMIMIMTGILGLKYYGVQSK